MNKQQDKEKFFALYWEQRIGYITSNGFYPTYRTLPIDNTINIEKVEHLELRNLEDITDEEARELGYDDLREFSVANLCPAGVFWEYEHFLLNESDYLRSKGFLLPFLNYSVEEILEMGWAKYKEI